MADYNHLMIAILKFLDSEKESTTLSKESKESIQVAAECLEEAYKVSLIVDADKYPLPASLPELFNAGLQQKGGATVTAKPTATPTQSAPSQPEPAQPAPSQEDKEEADRQKNQGNEFMKQEKYEEALECYTAAVEKDSQNAVYFCNRAAAFSKLDKHEMAVQDCIQALHIDPNYSKAFGRKGLAHAALGQHLDAKVCYEEALKLDPSNGSYKNNLELTEEKIRELATGRQGDGAAGPSPFPGLDGMGLGSFLQNPALMNMAAQMMQNPQMQQMMAGLMQGANSEAGGQQGIGSLLQAGQQLATEMERNNPDLVNQLRSQWSQRPEDEDSQNPPDSSSS